MVTSDEMLEMIIGSLRSYPNGGGDIRVIAEVDRIVAAAVKAAKNQSTEQTTLRKRLRCFVVGHRYVIHLDGLGVQTCTRCWRRWWWKPWMNRGRPLPPK